MPEPTIEQARIEPIPSGRIDRNQVRADWARDGYSCELWVDPPERVWSDFVHDADLRLLLLQGSIQVALPDRTVQLTTGDELDVPAHTRFTIRHLSDQSARWLHGYRQPARTTRAS